MATSRLDYTGEAIEAARSVLLELTHLLGEYRDDIVLIGGWVPELLVAREGIRHVGSLDIDLALDHRRILEPGYKSIKELLISRGYTEGEQPFIFFRKVRVGSQEVTVEVDLLAGEYEGTGHGHRTQRVQDIMPRKARGAELAFEMVEEVEISGRLPNGAMDSARVRVAGIVPFLVMKGMALDSRLKEKDAADVYFCVRNYPGGMDALVEGFRRHLDNGLVREGLRKIAQKFSSLEHVGPVSVVEFEGVGDGEERAILQRDAYERVTAFLRLCRALPDSE